MKTPSETTIVCQVVNDLIELLSATIIALILAMVFIPEYRIAAFLLFLPCLVITVFLVTLCILYNTKVHQKRQHVLKQRRYYTGRRMKNH